MGMEKKDLKAYQMHVSFFDHVKAAIDAGFYCEAIFLEYAAIESRLEGLCGCFGLPCNRELPDKDRKKVNISQRVECLKERYSLNPMETQRSKTEMPVSEWEKLSKWIGKGRNPYVHGLFKKPEKYFLRMDKISEVATEGYRLADLLYKETKRVKGILSRKTNLLSDEKKTCNAPCFRKR